MEERVTDIVEDVTQDLADHLTALEKQGMVYAREYADWIVAGRNPHGSPHYPRDLHPMGAKMIRELVLDRAALR